MTPDLNRTPAAGFGGVRRCGDSGGKTKVGEPCRSPLGLGVTGLCANHDPDRQAEVREVRAAGGRAEAQRSGLPVSHYPPMYRHHRGISMTP